MSEMNKFDSRSAEKSLIVTCMDKGKKSLQQLMHYEGTDLSAYKDWKRPDLKNNKFVLIIGGGLSAEREVSLMSSDNIIDALLELDHYVIFTDMRFDIANVVNFFRPDIVYNALHGTYGEDGCLPGMLNILSIPYTGPGVLASAAAFNKKKSHALFQSNGICSASLQIIHRKDVTKKDPMPRPYIIKPISQGSSFGIKVVFPEDDFIFSDYQFEYGEEVIVEQYIKGREIQVAILNGKPLGTMEIILPANKRFFDYEAKYTENCAKHLMPARLEKSAEEKLLDIATKVCHIFDCTKGMIRLEFIYNEQNNEFYILELNTHPGMTNISICPEIAAAYGFDYKTVIREILKLAKYEK